MASTWIFSFNRSWPSPALASGFVLTVWGVMLLGWLNSRFNSGAGLSEPESVAAPAIEGARSGHGVPGFVRMPRSPRQGRRGLRGGHC